MGLAKSFIVSVLLCSFILEVCSEVVLSVGRNGTNEITLYCTEDGLPVSDAVFRLNGTAIGPGIVLNYGEEIGGSVQFTLSQETEGVYSCDRNDSGSGDGSTSNGVLLVGMVHTVFIYTPAKY